MAFALALAGEDVAIYFFWLLAKDSQLLGQANCLSLLVRLVGGGLFQFRDDSGIGRV